MFELKRLLGSWRAPQQGRSHGDNAVTVGPDRCFVLTPLDHAEVLTLQKRQTAPKNRQAHPELCESEGIWPAYWRQVVCSKVALEMYLDGDADALKRYLRGGPGNSQRRLLLQTVWVKCARPVNIHELMWSSDMH